MFSLYRALEDVSSFDAPNVAEGEVKEKYCLQPVVVRNVGTKDEPLWEVIDGQQRLTTIKIILEYFHILAPLIFPKPFSLIYQTRAGDKDYFTDMTDAAKAERSIDTFHIHRAYSVVRNWFEGKSLQNPATTTTFHGKIIQETSIIWYDVAGVGAAPDENAAIDIFTRLNVGKISLTNAELIKALFLQRRNFAVNEIETMQLQIATEWDYIQKKLENDSLWFFLYNPLNSSSTTRSVVYESRIEYIFDLKMGTLGDKSDQPYATFIKFNELFKEQLAANSAKSLSE